MNDRDERKSFRSIPWQEVVQFGLSGLMVVVTLLCLFTPDLLILKKLAAMTLYVMLGLLGGGLVFFMFNQPRLMMVSMLCCCVLALYLRESSSKQLRLARVTESPSIRISHVSLGNVESDYSAVVEYLLGIDVDLLSFQELTPDWNTILTDRLSARYPYISTFTRLDQYGLGFFSRYPIDGIDTFYFREIPNLHGTIRLDETHRCHIISSQVMPPVNASAFAAIRSHFSEITTFLNGLSGPAVVLGDFHLPPWTEEIQTFKTSGRLMDSRRDIHPRNLDGSFFLPRIPVEHILYTEPFECTSFTEIGNTQVGRIGISGHYQMDARHEAMGE